MEAGLAEREICSFSLITFPCRPPPVSSFSQHYPGNDSRYVKYLNDCRYSIRESTIRSIEAGKVRGVFVDMFFVCVESPDSQHGIHSAFLLDRVPPQVAEE